VSIVRVFVDRTLIKPQKNKAGQGKKEEGSTLSAELEGFFLSVLIVCKGERRRKRSAFSLVCPSFTHGGCSLWQPKASFFFSLSRERGEVVFGMQKSCPFRDVKNTQKDFIRNRVVDQKKMELKENESREEVFSRFFSLCGVCVVVSSRDKQTHAGEETRKAQKKDCTLKCKQTRIFSWSFFPVALSLFFFFLSLGWLLLFFLLSKAKTVGGELCFFSR
jgi:hypothetical protein